MATEHSRAGGVARIYAEAWLQLAQSQGVLDDFLEELRELRKLLLAQPRLTDLFEDASLAVETRSKMFEQMFRGRVSDLLLNGLQVINAKGRTRWIMAILDAFENLYRAAMGRMEVFVTTATELTAPLTMELSGAMRKLTGREPVLKIKVDPRILGGLVLRFGDTQLDTSLARHLRRVRDRLGLRAAQELVGDRELRYVEGSPV